MTALNALIARDFLVASLQATVYTPAEEVSAVKLLSGLVPSWLDRFDGDPIVLPSQGLPRDVPRVILQDKSGAWRCEVASARINLFWRKPNEDGPVLSPRSFYAGAARMLNQYTEFLHARAGRLAAVLNRYAAHPSPGIFLATHFCQERWLSGPLDRPESFELHAHKRLKLAGSFNVNSWIRNKSGAVAREKSPEPIVLVEQDLNTLSEEAEERAFTPSEIEGFFAAVVDEFDASIGSYYPTGGK